MQSFYVSHHYSHLEAVPRVSSGGRFFLARVPGIPPEVERRLLRLPTKFAGRQEVLAPP